MEGENPFSDRKGDPTLAPAPGGKRGVRRGEPDRKYGEMWFVGGFVVLPRKKRERRKDRSIADRHSRRRIENPRKERLGILSARKSFSPGKEGGPVRQEGRLQRRRHRGNKG